MYIAKVNLRQVGQTSWLFII